VRVFVSETVVCSVIKEAVLLEKISSITASSMMTPSMKFHSCCICSFTKAQHIARAQICIHSARRRCKRYGNIFTLLIALLWLVIRGTDTSRDNRCSSFIGPRSNAFCTALTVLTLVPLSFVFEMPVPPQNALRC